VTSALLLSDGSPPLSSVLIEVLGLTLSLVLIEVLGLTLSLVLIEVLGLTLREVLIEVLGLTLSLVLIEVLGLGDSVSPSPQTMMWLMALSPPLPPGSKVKLPFVSAHTVSPSDAFSKSVLV
jgi:hypothetical protein